MARVQLHVRVEHGEALVFNFQTLLSVLRFNFQISFLSQVGVACGGEIWFRNL